MQNIIPRKTIAAVEKAGVMVVGATQYGDTIPLTVVTEAAFRAKIASVTESIVGRDQAKTELITRELAVRALIETIRAFLTKARDSFKPKLNNHYYQGWDVTGFIGSLLIPRGEAKVVQLLQLVKGFLLANATFEVENLGVTGAAAGALLTQVETARGAVNLQEKLLRDMMVDREAKAAVLRKSMSSMIGELKSRLTPLDSRWLAFGLNMPGAVATPEVPSNVTVLLVGPTAAAVRWGAAVRAAHYRVWIRTAATEPWVNVGSPADLDFTIEVLLRNTKTEVAVSAVNSGGESALSAFTAITTPA